MRKKSLYTVAVAIILILSHTPLLITSSTTAESEGPPEGWSEDIRLTEHERNDRKPRMTTWGNIVHMVWDKSLGEDHGYVEVFYMKSVDSGWTWSEPIQLSEHEYPAWNQDIAVHEDTVFVVWDQHGPASAREIFFRRSLDGGDTWEDEQQITQPTGEHKTGPSIAVSDDGMIVHVAWIDARHGGILDTDIYYVRSTDGGLTWEEEVRITEAPWGSTGPRLAVDGETVHLVWYDERKGYMVFDIYYRRSTDNGATWEEEVALSDSPNVDASSDVAVWEGNVHVIWYERLSAGEHIIHYRRSTNNGSTWGPSNIIVGPTTYVGFPSIATTGSDVCIVWFDDRDGPDEIYFKQSVDGGITWGEDTRLTYSSSKSRTPAISLSGDTIHVVWHDDRDGDYYEIYYKRNPDFNDEPIIPDHIVVRPETASVDAGESVTFTATAYDEHGVELMCVTEDTIWSIQEDAGGSWDQNVYTSENPGNWTVTGTYVHLERNMTDEVQLRVITLDHIMIFPPSTTVTAGASVVFTATAYENFGEELFDVTGDSAWSVDSGAGGSWVGNTYHTEYAGTWTVTGTYSGFSDSAVLTINPGVVHEVVIYPDEPLTLMAGEGISFTAEAYDGMGNLLSDTVTDFIWTGADSDGVFVEESVGTYQVSAAYGTVTSPSTTVTVIPEEVHTVTISPTGTVSATAGEDLIFGAQALDVYGNLITDTVSHFTWTGASDVGVFNQGIVGEYTVRATYQGVSSPEITVTVEPGKVDTVIITPADPQNVTAGVDLIFTAEAVDAFRNLITDIASDFTWTGADENGVFNEETVGTYQVTASYEEVSSSQVEVTVVPGAVDSVEISPDTTQTIDSGDTVAFSASAYDPLGNLITDSTGDFTWSGAGTGGIFEETEPGTYNVSATYDGVRSIEVTVIVAEVDDDDDDDDNGDDNGDDDEPDIPNDPDDDEKPSNILSDNLLVMILLVIGVIVAVVALMVERRGRTASPRTEEEICEEPEEAVEDTELAEDNEL